MELVFLFVEATEEQKDNPCESCYFEEPCLQTEHMPKEILECQGKDGYWVIGF
jgi:hypothetical protein